MLGLLIDSALRCLVLGCAVWLGLKLLRVQNPHAQMMAWKVVLIASLSMPLLPHWVAVRIPAAPPPSDVVETTRLSPEAIPRLNLNPLANAARQDDRPSAKRAELPLAPPPRSQSIALGHPPAAPPKTFRWLAVATDIYAIGVGLLMLRLLTGIILTWRLVRAARPIRESWTGELEVRTSDAVGMPVTFGSIILLPPECVHWSAVKRQAVLSHEGSHVANADFYTLLLAALNRAVFWFNPFVWWHLTRLAELAETISDDAAIEVLCDRPSYAEILLDVARGVQRNASVSLAMARPCTVRQRVERILSATALPIGMGWQKRMLIAAALLPLVVLSAGTVAGTSTAPKTQTVALASVASPTRAGPFTDTRLLDGYAGFYATDPKILPDRVLTVTYQGSHLFVQMTGHAKQEVFPESNHVFLFGEVGDQITFRSDDGGLTEALTLRQNRMDIEATRVDAAAAQRAADLFDKRFAEQAKPLTPVNISSRILDLYTGYYQMNPKSVISITREGDQLFVQLTTEGRRPLLPASATEFFCKSALVQISFITDGIQPASGLTLHQNGWDWPLTRINEVQANAVLTEMRQRTNERMAMQSPNAVSVADPSLLDRYTGLYQQGPNSIFTITRESDRLFAQRTGQPLFQIFQRAEGEFFYQGSNAEITFSNGAERSPMELILHQNGHDLRATKIAEIPHGGDGEAQLGATTLDSYSGWYELSPTRAISVTRAGDRLVIKETGRPSFEVSGRASHEFLSADGATFVIFMLDDQGQPNELVLQDPAGARRALRIDDTKARQIEATSARQLTLAPGRFRDQTPMSGSKSAVVRAIDEIQRGAPSYDHMSALLADQMRPQLGQLHAMMVALGSVEAVFFRGVGPGGYDIYGVKFANGFAEFRILVDADGKTEDVLFRPGGDDTPGGIVECSQENTLKAVPDTAPIRLIFFNASGAEIHLSELDSEGRRTSFGAIGDERSVSIVTYVGHPWIITDSSGQCVESVLPGRLTRFILVEPTGADQQPKQPLSRRNSPISGTEEALRQYINGLVRGEPNYDQMTPEVAAVTRQQLLLDQAILERLGSVRAMSFRGVTALDNDIYMVQFSNGSAEWRIGLAKEGKIGRIALGPQY